MALERDTQTQTQTEAQKALAGGSSGATTTSATAASMRHTLMLHNAMARLQSKSPLNFRADNLALILSPRNLAFKLLDADWHEPSLLSPPINSQPHAQLTGMKRVLTFYNLQDHFF